MNLSRYKSNDSYKNKMRKNICKYVAALTATEKVIEDYAS